MILRKFSLLYLKRKAQVMFINDLRLLCDGDAPKFRLAQNLGYRLQSWNVPFGASSTFDFVHFYRAIHETIPMTTKIGSAIERKPPKTNPIKITGRNIKVSKILVIPHAALNEKNSNFPKTQNIKNIKTNVNILIPPKHDLTTKFAGNLRFFLYNFF